MNGGGHYGFCSDSCSPSVSTRFVYECHFANYVVLIKKISQAWNFLQRSRGQPEEQTQVSKEMRFNIMNSCIIVSIEGKMMQSEKTLLSLMGPLRFELFPSFSNPLLLGSGAAANIVQWSILTKRRHKKLLGASWR